jgi:peroxiredoxin Q/BCP
VKQFMKTSVKQGKRAPDVIIPLHTGQTVPLADLYRERAVVLFFYPRDNTSICTKEACAFRDAYEDFVEAGATVVGVSSDSAESHRRFAEDHRLPFLLVADEDGALRRAFGVPKTLGISPGRVTYVIDRQGVIRLVFNAQFAAERHTREALAALHELAEEYNVERFYATVPWRRRADASTATIAALSTKPLGSGTANVWAKSQS